MDFIHEGDPNRSDGPAFRRSGRALETLENGQRFALLVPEEADAVLELAAESIAEVVDVLVVDWTETQARAVAGMLAGVGTDREVTQPSVAEGWDPEPITPQAVGRTLDRAGWHRLERAIERYERLVDELPPPSRESPSFADF